MLETLSLIHWQCHKSIALELGKITVLVGDNDTGKSAVIRALRWLALNEWDGKANDFITWGSEAAQVSVTGECRVVSRIKSKTENIYTLDDQKFKAFGPDGPLEVAQFLKLRADNFQNQGDPAYWLSLTAGKAATALNEIFHLTEIDSSLLAAGQEVRHAKSLHEVAQERLQTAQAELETLSWVPEADKLLTRIEECEDELGVIAEECGRLEEAVSWLQYGEENIEYLENQIVDLEVITESELSSLTDAIQLLEYQCHLEQDLLDLQAQVKLKEAKLKAWLKGKCPLCQRQ